MARQETSFDEFLKQREAAARAYTSGDPSALRALSTRELAATFFGPRGGQYSGAKTVSDKYEQDAAAFKPGPGTETHFEILQSAESDGIAYWVGFQHATVRLGDNPQPVQMSLRVTELFRREAGTWKLVHRHADPLAKAQT